MPPSRAIAKPAHGVSVRPLSHPPLSRVRNAANQARPTSGHFRVNYGACGTNQPPVRHQHVKSGNSAEDRNLTGNGFVMTPGHVVAELSEQGLAELTIRAFDKEQATRFQAAERMAEMGGQHG